MKMQASKTSLSNSNNTHTTNTKNTKNTTNPNQVLALVLACYVMIILDISIVITGLPEIQAELKFSNAMLSWVQNAYTLTFGSLLLLGARSGDLLGRQRMLMIGLALFALSSVLIAMAQSPLALLGGRALQGFGAAILAPSTLALLSSYFPEGPKRIKALAWYAATAGIGASLGLVLGGLFAGLLSWRVGFWVNAPVGLLLMLATWKILRDQSAQPPAGKKSLADYDITGAITSTLGMGALVFGTVHSTQAGWTDAITLASLATAVLFLGWFLRIESRHPTPLLPMRLFKSRERVSAYLARMMFLGAMVGFLFFATQLLQRILGFSPVEAGIAFLPFTVLTFVASTQVPRLTRKLGNHNVALLALVILGIGMAWLAMSDGRSDYWLAIGLPMLLIGLGNGAVLGPLTIAGVAGIREEDSGAASGMVNVAHQLGGTLGLSILVVIVAATEAGSSSALTDETQLAHQLTVGFEGCLVFVILAGVIMTTLNRKPVPQTV